MRCEKCGEEMYHSHTTRTNVKVWVCKEAKWSHPFRAIWNNKWRETAS